MWCCFVDFHKAFDPVSLDLWLIGCLQELQLPHDVIWAVMSHCEIVVGRVRAHAHGLSGERDGTIGAKQGCPLLPTLFGLYIDGIASFLENFGGKGLLLYADDIVLSSEEGLQKHLHALDFAGSETLRSIRARRR